jgi:hypothetical protein
MSGLHTVYPWAVSARTAHPRFLWFEYRFKPSDTLFIRGLFLPEWLIKGFHDLNAGSNPARG